MYRQILTQATGDAADAAVFATAFAAAQRFGGQLEYLHVRPDPAEVLLNMADAGAGGEFVLAGLMESAERDAAAGEVRARLACNAFCVASGLAIDADGTEFLVRVGDEANWIVDHGRAADLIVLGRRGVPGDVDTGLLQTVLLESGRPLLVAADAVPPGSFDTVAIAWKNTAEAARAVGAAMPFIDQAKRVLVLTVDDEGTPRGPVSSDDSTERLLHAVRCHNSSAIVQHLSPDTGAPVSTLLQAVADAGAGLLVMGGYGHGRLREAVFGGFTAEVLRGAGMPVLLMH